MSHTKDSLLTLSKRFDQALLYAHQLHREQLRKETAIPYITHLMSVCALVLEHGGDEDQAIAALLHDAAEDQGGQATLDEIRKTYGTRVAKIVEVCTDTVVTPKPPWKARKEAYITHLKEAPKDAFLVSMADKVHNARSILADLRTQGDDLWKRFSGGKDGTLWYYRALSDAFRAIRPGVLQQELERTVAELELIAFSRGHYAKKVL